MYVAAETIGQCGGRDRTLVCASPRGGFVASTGNEMTAIGDETSRYLETEQMGKELALEHNRFLAMESGGQQR